MEKPTQEEIKEFHDRNMNNVTHLAMFIKSLDWSFEDIMATFTIFMASLMNVGKIDEEELRDMFRTISKMKDRIVFK